ncbi:MAG TPA: glycosyltransferase family 2 protein [Arenimonas sp.]|nr:glycosyltransferase family 2 protein [Arenimonas sp.]HOZ06252.1 glycosyltransferase family 2 protein [Arenimonas sp.]HPO24294.1 glycosyltransferase family 2 protein [Arenimonas sp.]HPW31741.1 glycosyltransferase family 2 protein [Arenimonas sp.]
MKVSIIVTTYNWESALESVLESIALQTRLPDEVIVADDGSTIATKNLIQQIAKNYPVSLKHSWQEDDGFRLSRSRNLAIAMSQGEYIIIIDGDMVLDTQFVADHLRAAKTGFMVQGSRILTLPSFDAKKLLHENKKLHFFSRGIDRRRHTLRMPKIANLLLKLSEGKKRDGVKGCNQGWWRTDLIALNGFDERFIGWGREDDDILARAFRLGLKRRDLRFSGLAAHIYHHERQPEGINPNDRWLNDNSERNVTACELGLDQHLERLQPNPLTDLRIA